MMSTALAMALGFRQRGSRPLVRLISTSCSAAQAFAKGAVPATTPPGYTAEGVPFASGRPRLVVLGTGWSAARLLHDIDPKRYDITVVSQRNHMVFTPLLASATVGTLEPRSVAVHAHDIQKALFHPQNGLLIAEAKSVDPDKKVVECSSEDGLPFRLHYDKLAICTGSLVRGGASTEGSTFGIPGVLEHTHFLRDIANATRIRSTLTKNIALAGTPGRSSQEFQRLLHIVIVGGGPTGVEVAGELTDLIRDDLRKLYPERAHAMRLTLIEGREVLGSFDEHLREYAIRKLVKSGVSLKKGTVKSVSATQVELTDGSVLSYGLCIWSTGVGPTPFTLALPFARTKGGRIAVDGHMRVQVEQPAHADIAVDKDAKQPEAPEVVLAPVPDVYALGDCCANASSPLPALAQVAEQQGRYLAHQLNVEATHKRAAGTAAEPPPAGPVSDGFEEFVFKSLGSMATIGNANAILQAGVSGKKQIRWGGFASWLAWRSAYLTRLGSISKRMSVAFNWTITLMFGRDLSRW